MRALIGVSVFLASGAAAAANYNVCYYDGKRLAQAPPDFTGEYTCRDGKDGRIVLREHQVRGRRDGEYTTFDPTTGKPEKSARYHDGQREGAYQFFQNGQLQQVLNFVHDKPQGVQRQFKDGKLHRMWLIDEQGQHATTVTFNKRGQLSNLDCKLKPIGKDDQAWCGFNGQQSTVTLYDEDGKRFATEQYLRGKRHGLSRRYQSSTGAIIEESRYENDRQLKDGQREFDARGAVASTSCDKKTCTETAFFDGGKQARSVTVRAGIRLVRQTEYYQNGKLKRDLLARDDHYLIAWYDDGGQVKERGTYLASLAEESSYIEDGVVEKFERDGSSRSRLTYRRGKLQGAATRTRRGDGNQLRQEAVYENGVLVREKIYSGDNLLEESEYLPDGSLRSHRDHRTGN